jgi:RNA polymerase sigma-70 factor (ECF subfamily)
MATSPQLPPRRPSHLTGRADEEHLIERVRDGDESSLIIIYDRYSSLAYTLACHVLRDPSAAEDIVQDVFLQLWREPKAYDYTRGSLSGWIAMNARHRAIDSWRKHRRETPMPEGFEKADLNPAPAAYFPDIDKVLTCLSASQRDILEVSYFGGLSHSEIALQMGLPLGTVKSKIRQALQSVRRQLMPQTIKERKTKRKPPSNDGAM